MPGGLSSRGISKNAWISWQVCVEGDEGLVLVPAESSMKLLQVEKAPRWCSWWIFMVGGGLGLMKKNRMISSFSN